MYKHARIVLRRGYLSLFGVVLKKVRCIYSRGLRSELISKCPASRLLRQASTATRDGVDDVDDITAYNDRTTRASTITLWKRDFLGKSAICRRITIGQSIGYSNPLKGRDANWLHLAIQI